MPKPTLGALLLLLGCVSAFSQQPPPPPAERNATGTLRAIIPGHYVYSSATYNSGLFSYFGSLTFRPPVMPSTWCPVWIARIF